MRIYYSDTSAVVKLYLPETGSTWITSEYHQSDVAVIIGDITIVEVPAAFKRAEREKRLSAMQCQQALTRFDADCAQAFLMEAITPAVLIYARNLIERHPLRAYDAIQLATALNLYPSVKKLGDSSFTFISADDSLNQAALSEGLIVDNPNSHP